MPAKQPELDLEELAGQYGWAMAVLDAIPEVKKLFQLYVKENWTESKLQAKIRQTKWYKTKSESERSGAILKLTDPKEFQRRVESMWIHARNMYQELAGGQSIGPKGKTSKFFTTMATQAVLLGWTDEELKNALSKAVNYNALLNQGNLGGIAGQTEDMIRKAVADYGVKVSGEWMTNRIKNMVTGVEDQNSIMDSIKTMAKSRYRAYADDFDRGLTLADVAEPYRQSMANLLELNINDVNLMDQKIQGALTRMDPNSQKPQPMALWEFEDHLRGDSRWLQTNNARESMTAIAHKIGQDWGLSI